MNTEQDYLNLMNLAVQRGKLVQNRTGIPAYTYPHCMLSFDLAAGFPLMTTKKMPWKSICVELEFFIRGYTDKRWLQERGCHFWDEWCDPTDVKHLPPGERPAAALRERALGPVYGYQWRHFNGNSSGYADQLRFIINELKTNPLNRQLVCSAWNPNQIHRQALPPCHVLWHVFFDGERLHLSWFQRSCDAFLGVPCNIASYALLLSLIANHVGMTPGIVTGFFSNWHVYQNHMNQVATQVSREPLAFPHINLLKGQPILEWTHKDVDLIDYNPYFAIKGDVAV